MASRANGAGTSKGALRLDLEPLDDLQDMVLDLTVGLDDLAAEDDELDLGDGFDLSSEEDGDDDQDDDAPHTTYEEAHAKVATEVRTAFMQRAKDDKQRFMDATDSEHWLCLCFTTREQKEAFIQAVQWAGVEPDDKYVYGEDVATALNIELPPARFVPPGQKVNKDMVQLGVIGDE